MINWSFSGRLSKNKFEITITHFVSIKLMYVDLHDESVVFAIIASS